jgi:hypothetical protein
LLLLGLGGLLLLPLLVLGLRWATSRQVVCVCCDVVICCCCAGVHCESDALLWLRVTVRQLASLQC